MTNGQVARARALEKLIRERPEQAALIGGIRRPTPTYATPGRPPSTDASREWEATRQATPQLREIITHETPATSLAKTVQMTKELRTAYEEAPSEATYQAYSEFYQRQYQPTFSAYERWTTKQREEYISELGRTHPKFTSRELENIQANIAYIQQRPFAEQAPLMREYMKQWEPVIGARVGEDIRAIAKSEIADPWSLKFMKAAEAFPEQYRGLPGPSEEIIAGAAKAGSLIVGAGEEVFYFFKGLIEPTTKKITKPGWEITVPKRYPAVSPISVFIVPEYRKWAPYSIIAAPIVYPLEFKAIGAGVKLAGKGIKAVLQTTAKGLYKVVPPAVKAELVGRKLVYPGLPKGMGFQEALKYEAQTLSKVYGVPEATVRQLPTYIAKKRGIYGIYQYHPSTIKVSKLGKPLETLYHEFGHQLGGLKGGTEAFANLFERTWMKARAVWVPRHTWIPRLLGVGEAKVRVVSGVTKLRTASYEAVFKGTIRTERVFFGEVLKPAPRWLMPKFYEKLMPSGVRATFAKYQHIRGAVRPTWMSKTIYEAMPKRFLETKFMTAPQSMQVTMRGFMIGGKEAQWGVGVKRVEQMMMGGRQALRPETLATFKPTLVPQLIFFPAPYVSLAPLVSVGITTTAALESRLAQRPRVGAGLIERVMGRTTISPKLGMAPFSATMPAETVASAVRTQVKQAVRMEQVMGTMAVASTAPALRPLYAPPVFPFIEEPRGRRPRQPVLPDIGKLYRERAFDVRSIVGAVFRGAAGKTSRRRRKRRRG